MSNDNKKFKNTVPSYCILLDKLCFLLNMSYKFDVITYTHIHTHMNIYNSI